MDAPSGLAPDFFWLKKLATRIKTQSHTARPSANLESLSDSRIEGRFEQRIWDTISKIIFKLHMKTPG
jgi:hypothetical protein